MTEQGRKPGRTGKKSHFKVESLNCKQTIDKMLAAGHTIDDIWEAVKQAGEEIGRTSIWRYASSWEKTAERFRRAREQAQVLIEAVRDGGPNTDLAEVANSLLMQGLVERLADAEPDEFKSMGIEKVGKVVATLERSAVARERLKLQFTKGVDAAVEILDQRLKAALVKHPELAAQVRQVLTEAAAEAKAQVDK